MSSPGAPSSAPNRRQKRMGPAPFASFEDLSDELDSPEDKNASGSVVRLPGIREDVTPCSPAPQDQIKPEFVYTGISLIGAPSTPTMTSPTPPQPPARSSLQTPSAPRIDISRASSSSHHDSKDSSPERELYGTQEPANKKLGLGFREEGTLDLRSSTEELDFQQEAEAKKIIKVRPHSPITLQDDSYHSHHRKDSQSSEIGLLCISGRTSRLSSIGSQGSAHSRVSNASHLSVISGQSGLSRSPSPHKMLLETSFCGTKPQKKTQTADSHEGTKDDLEKMLLKRKHDPTQALFAEGISINRPREEKKIEIQKVKSDIKITVDKPPVNNDILKPKFPKHIVGESGTEYIYIPLKGPLPDDPKITSSNGTTTTKSKVRETKSASLSLSKSITEIPKQKSKSASPSPIITRHQDEPKYIRIKLKPDHLYEDFSGKTPEHHKPDSLNLTDKTKKPAQTFEQIMSYQPPKAESLHTTPTVSPKLGRHLKEPSKSPSPSLSRKSSFASIFKSRETISPESPIVPGRKKDERRRSRSKSRDRTSTESIDSKGRQKSSMFSLFKSKKTSQRDLVDTSTPDLPNLEGLVNVEFKFNSDNNSMPKKKKYYEAPLDGDSIRIPLHSPTYYEQKNVILQDFKTSSQDSQETVIEVAPKTVESIEIAPEIKKDYRQSSTSSENIVFSTRIGSTNELFTTKLPKDKFENISEIATTAIVEVQRAETPSPEIIQPIESIKKVESIKKIESIKKVESIEPIETVEVAKTIERVKSIEIIPAIPSLPSTSSKLSEIISKPEEEHYSSESERDSEFDKKEEPVEPERKGLVLQQDSFEDELPYIPTTLPQERSVAVPIVPVKQRSTFEMKTCPIDRPRSTTPINPTCLEDYCEEVIGSINTENITRTIEKLKICLPREDNGGSKDKSPRRTSSTNWFDFSKINVKKGSTPQEPDVPPPLPPKGLQKEWINFEEIPERRRPPKRIQTIPSRGNIDVPESVLQENVIYTYVNPEDCKCECHERDTQPPEEDEVREDELPLLEDDQVEEDKVVHVVDKMKLDVAILDRRSIVSDSSVDLSTNIDHPDANGIDHSLQTPFTSDLGISSNRSSIISQDDAQSPDTDSPNAFPKKT